MFTENIGKKCEEKYFQKGSPLNIANNKLIQTQTRLVASALNFAPLILYGTEVLLRSAWIIIDAPKWLKHRRL